MSERVIKSGDTPKGEMETDRQANRQKSKYSSVNISRVYSLISVLITEDVIV